MEPLTFEYRSVGSVGVDDVRCFGMRRAGVIHSHAAGPDVGVRQGGIADVDSGEFYGRRSPVGSYAAAANGRGGSGRTAEADVVHNVYIGTIDCSTCSRTGGKAAGSEFSLKLWSVQQEVSADGRGISCLKNLTAPDIFSAFSDDFVVAVQERGVTNQIV